MITISRSAKSAGRWITAILTPLVIGIPAVAQQAPVSAHLSADEVIQRVVEMNDSRARALEGYSSLRTYSLDCHCLSHKKADMVVRIDYKAPDSKQFRVLSESGSGTIRDRVFNKLLEAEQESMRQENQRQSAISPENYQFQMTDYEKNETGEYYVLDARPKNKNKFLFRGRIWVDAKDFAISRVEGEPAVSPSWWTEKTDFKRRYQKIGDFWLPKSNHSETRVRVFGTAVLTIDYRDYEITRAGGTTVARAQLNPLIAQTSQN
jgi:hypothetical protein